MLEHNINSLDNFICGWYLDNNSICDEIIKKYNNFLPKNQYISDDNKKYDNKKIIECTLNNEDELIDTYIEEVLLPTTHNYVSKYPSCNIFDSWAIKENVTFQKYEKGHHHNRWHCERGSAKFPFNARHLSFMTYLNTVSESGETEFYHQNTLIKPEKGLTLIWPTDWTFTLKHNVTYEEKYVIKGFFSFLE
jgi:hypothetical protein